MLIFFYRERVTTGAIRAHAGSSAQLRVSVFQARRCSSGGSKVKTEARDRDPNVLQLPDDFVTSDDSRGADQPTDRLREVNGARRSNHPRNFLRTCILTLLNAIEQFFSTQILEKYRKRIMQIDFIEGFLSREFSCQKHLPKWVKLTVYMKFLRLFRFKSKCEEG